MRRKGTCTPCDPCCINKDGIKTINGQYPDPNREFNIYAGEGVSIIPDDAGIRIGIRLASPMVFRGTVGTGGTVSTLPQANADNLGWVYIAITAGNTPDTPPKPYDVGDMLISNSIEWSVVPSGDDPVDWSQIENKPDTVAGYGITDAVDTGSIQTINKLKILRSNVSADTLLALRTNKAYVSGNQFSPQIEFSADNTNKKNGSIGSQRTSATNSRVFLDVRDPVTGNWIAGLYLITDGTNAWVESPVRGYDASNVNDVVTIGSLAANPDIVHTTGNETLSGTKVFLNTPFVKSTDIKPSDTSQTTTKWLNAYFIRGSDNNILGGIEYGMRTTGNRVIRLRLTKADGTYAYKTLFEIDNAGNVIV